MLISIDAGKIFDKIQHLLTHTKKEIEEKIPQLHKEHLPKTLQLTSYLM